ncbi:hypothetical protein SBF1_1970016 [Candidatus Desulfosporosinus infrequens]|uniref:Uncharacterized protein n=1 Tax=Candidatus Desulfosporosinus infrequens TaxID=2043169 RepID=A0A2U3KGM6_9FIRM|nr:hypothetical protein SBF1_1970016 [Candidatus Desulfosporosinus infrequens]
MILRTNTILNHCHPLVVVREGTIIECLVNLKTYCKERSVLNGGD